MFFLCAFLLWFFFDSLGVGAQPRVGRLFVYSGGEFPLLCIFSGLGLVLWPQFYVF